MDCDNCTIDGIVIEGIDGSRRTPCSRSNIGDVAAAAGAADGDSGGGGAVIVTPSSTGAAAASASGALVGSDGSAADGDNGADVGGVGSIATAADNRGQHKSNCQSYSQTRTLHHGACTQQQFAKLHGMDDEFSTSASANDGECILISQCG